MFFALEQGWNQATVTLTCYRNHNVGDLGVVLDAAPNGLGTHWPRYVGVLVGGMGKVTAWAVGPVLNTRRRQISGSSDSF